MPDNKIKALYDAASQSYDLGSFEDFTSKLQDPAKRKSFYEGVGAEFDLGDFKDFESKVILKKKEDTISTPSETPVEKQEEPVSGYLDPNLKSKSDLPTSESTPSSSDLPKTPSDPLVEPVKDGELIQGEFDTSALYDQPKPGLESAPEFARAERKQKFEDDQDPHLKHVKRADEYINKASENINSLEEEVRLRGLDNKTQASFIEEYKKGLEDPNLTEEQRAEIIKQYKFSVDSYNKNIEFLKGAEKKYAALDNVKNQMSQIKDQAKELSYQRNLDAKSGGLGIFSKAVYNAAVPATIKGIGALTALTGVVASPDMLPKRQELEGKLKEKYGDNIPQKEIDALNKVDKLRGNPVTKAASSWLMDFSNEIEAEIPSSAQESILDGFTMDKAANLAGQGIGSMVAMLLPAGAMGKAGKAAQVATAWGVSSTQIMGSVYEEAKDIKGISDEHAAYLSFLIAVPAGGIDAVSGTKFMGSKVASKKLFQEAVKNLGEGKITTNAINESVKKSLPKVIKEKALDVGGEVVTESLQQAEEIAGKKIYDKITDQDKYKELTAEESGKQILEAGISSIFAATPMSIITGSSSNQNIYNQAVEMGKSKAKLDYFKSMLDNSLKNGVIDQVKYDNIKNNINSIIEADEKIPSSIVKPERRAAAVKLISEKNKIEADIEGKDKALTIKQRERLTAIDSELEGIAKGRNLVEMERKDLGKKVEKKEETQTSDQVQAPKETVEANVKEEVDRVVGLDEEAEDGATFNLDGTKHDKGGLVVPVASKNLKEGELTPQAISEFIEENKDKIGDSSVKVGIYKFPGSKTYSIDLNIVADPKNKKAALETGEILGQESLFNLDTFENEKTGADGKNPMNLTPDQFKEVQASLSKGEVPVFLKKEKLAPRIEKVKSALKAIDPRTKVISHETDEDFRKASIDADKRDGQSQEEAEANAEGSAYYDSTTGEIHLNLPKMKSNSLFHEGVHPILNAIEAVNPKLIEKLHTQVKAAEKKLGLDGKYSKEFASRYAEGSQKMEALTEFIADVADGKIEINESNYDKVKQIFSDMLEAIGLGDLAAKVNSVGDLKKLAEKISDSFETGEAVDVGEAGDVVRVGEVEPGNIKEAESGKNPFIQKQIPVKNLADVLSKYGNKMIAINSDPTKVGKVTLPSGKEIELFGGVMYAGIDENVKGEVGFAASKFAKVKILNKMAKETFKDNNGVGVVTIVAQKPESILGNYYALVYALDAIKLLPKTVINSKEFKNEFFGKDIVAIKDAFGAKYDDFVKKFSKMNFKSDEDIDLMVDELLGEVGNSFEARNSLIKNMLGGITAKSSRKETAGQPGYVSKKPMKFIAKELFNRHKINQESLFRLLGQEELVNEYFDNGNAGYVAAGFIHDANVDIEGVQKKGLEHPQFNAKFHGKDAFITDKLYSINKLMPAITGVNKSGKPFSVSAYTQVAGSMYPKGTAQQEGLKSKTKGIQSQKADPIGDTDKVKYMTEDGDGNYVFYHYGERNLSKKGIDPSKTGKNIITGRDEKPMAPAAFYYTEPNIKESGIGNFGHMVRLPKNKVYPFNEDPENFSKEAEKRFRKKHPNLAFDFNKQLAWTSVVAQENGYDITVANWDGIAGHKRTLRAQSPVNLKPEVFEKPTPGTYNQIEINEDLEFKSNRRKRKKVQKQKTPVQKQRVTSTKKVADRLSQAEKINEDLRQKIKDKGLSGDEFSSEEAKTITDAIIEEHGVEGAIDLANSGKIAGSVKAFAYGAAIDHYSELADNAKTPEEKAEAVERGAEITGMFVEDSRTYGRFIQAIGEYYKNSPLVIKKAAVNNLKKVAKEALAKLKRKKAKIRGAQVDFYTTAKKYVNKAAGKGLKTSKNIIEAQTKLDAIKDRFNSLKPKGQKQLTGYSDAQKQALLEAAAIHFGDFGKTSFNSFKKAMMDDFGITEADAKEIYYNEALTDLDEKGRTLDQINQDVFSDEYADEQQKILDKYFPQKKTEAPKKRKRDHEKIIEQYNAGVFGDKQNKDNIPFEELFYEKLGIVNPNKSEIQDKIGEFAEKMSRAPEGSAMWAEANQDMLDYLADQAYETAFSAGLDRATSMWYANILSSPATHLRNLQYNAIQTLMNPLLLAEKALIKGDLKSAKGAILTMLKGTSRGPVEAARSMMEGRDTIADEIGQRGALERSKKKLVKMFVVPGRALRAGDAIFTTKAYEDKLREVARNIALKFNPDISVKNLNSTVNDMLFGTSEQQEQALIDAKEQVKEFYGKDYDPNSKSHKRMVKIRAFQIIEEGRSPEIKDAEFETREWARKSTLVNKPTGMYGAIADIIQGINRAMGFTKIYMPFVNVPLNITQKMIDHTPVGLVKAWMGTEGFGSNKTELNDDQRLELLIKAANYTVAMAAMMLLNGDDPDEDNFVVTGAQHEDYRDTKSEERATAVKPYTVYVGGKAVFSYKMTPLAPLFLPAGYARDHKLYSETEEGVQPDKIDGIAAATLNYFTFLAETSTLKGLSDLMDNIKSINAKSGFSDKAAIGVANMINNMIPYSSAIKYTNRTVKAAAGKDDTKPAAFLEYMLKDIPFADKIADVRYDHYGLPVKENFDIPLVPIGPRGPLKEISDTNKYYKLTKSKGYMEKAYTGKKIFVNAEEITMTRKERDRFNKTRGDIVRKSLDGENVFYEKDKWGDLKKLSNGTTFDYLETLNNSEFKEKMDKLFKEATLIAKIKTFGDKVGITQDDLDSYSKKVLKKMDEEGWSKKGAEGEIEDESEKNAKKLKEYQKNHLLQMVIKNN